MILNPPIIQRLLRTWKLVTAQVPQEQQVDYLAAMFRPLLKPQLSYDLFLEFYHLYLQSIPMPTALEAWGIFFSQTSKQSLTTKTSTHTTP